MDDNKPSAIDRMTDRLRERQSGGAGKEEDEEELDFSKEPIFNVMGKPKEVAIPGLPDSYITIVPSVSYEVDCGRAKFGVQVQQLVKDHKGRKAPADRVETTFDFYGLFLYLVEHCLCDFQIVDPGEENPAKARKRYIDGRPQHTVAVFRSIQSPKLCNWISKQINKTLGWDDEGEDLSRAFRGETEEA